MHYEIKHLRVFIAVAEELNFHHAADRIAMTQPAVSRIVRELEERLDVKLFERTTRMVRLTAPGRHLLVEAKDILERMVRADENVRSIASGTRAILKIGFTTINGHTIAPEAIRQFSAENPGVRIDLVYSAAPQQRDGILTGELDGGFMEGSFQSSEVMTQLAGRHRLMAIMPKSHPLAAQDVLSVEDIVGENLILGHSDDWPTMREMVTRAFHQSGQVMRIHTEAPTLTMILGLVCAEMGITVFSGVPQFMGNTLVARPLLSSPPVLIETHFVWRRANTSIAVRRFRETVREVAARSHYLTPDPTDPPEGTATAR